MHQQEPMAIQCQHQGSESSVNLICPAWAPLGPTSLPYSFNFVSTVLLRNAEANAYVQRQKPSTGKSPQKQLVAVHLFHAGSQWISMHWVLSYVRILYVYRASLLDMI